MTPPPQPPRPEDRRFPAGFLWGTATSPTQVEGGVDNEWTDFTAQDGGNCRTACDHYHRYPEDIAWMARLGCNAYRFGLEWSRLQPAPFAPLAAAELDRYVDLLDRLKAAGLTPMVVLHHFANPPWVNRQGGWTNPATAAAFVDYTTRLVAALRDRVHLWNTFNEPDTYASVAYLLGGFPPRRFGRLDLFYRVIRHMAQAHLHASAVIRRAGGGARPHEVGIAKNWTFFQAHPPGWPWDAAAALACHTLFNRHVLHGFFGGRRRQASTFLGLNYYGRVRFHHGKPLIPASGASPGRLRDLGLVCDDMVERHPAGLEQILAGFRRDLNLPVYLTEHGAASTDEAFRERDLRANLAALHRAIADGSDVRGFFYWSLLDNFEWQFGYSKKFGLLAVDFSDPALPRTLKPLAEVYARICRSNSLTP